MRRVRRLGRAAAPLAWDRTLARLVADLRCRRPTGDAPEDNHVRLALRDIGRAP